MRLAGFEKGGFYPYPNHVVEEVSAAALTGSFRFHQEHAVAFSTPARVMAKSPVSWESCSPTDESVTFVWINRIQL
jgi:hypothetical protein